MESIRKEVDEHMDSIIYNIEELVENYINSV